MMILFLVWIWKIVVLICVLFYRCVFSLVLYWLLVVGLRLKLKMFGVFVVIGVQVIFVWVGVLKFLLVLRQLCRLGVKVYIIENDGVFFWQCCELLVLLLFKQWLLIFIFMVLWCILVCRVQVLMVQFVCRQGLRLVVVFILLWCNLFFMLSWLLLKFWQL